MGKAFIIKTTLESEDLGSIPDKLLWVNYCIVLTVPTSSQCCYCTVILLVLLTASSQVSLNPSLLSFPMA